jgi:integrase
MGRKRTPGIYKRKGIWHIDKQIFGRRICESTGTNSLEEAEKFLAKRTDQLREAQIYGVRPERSFRIAATKYLNENQHKSSIGDDAMHLKQLDLFIGDMPIEKIHTGTLQKFVGTRIEQGRKCKTINLALGVVRRILNLAASEWIDDSGLTWLAHAPKIRMLPTKDSRPAYPISMEEQEKLFSVLPLHLRRMALFKVNTGCREQEVCQLRWKWEIKIPELNTSVFLVPAYVLRQYDGYKSLVKNGEDRLVVLNDVAKSVIDEVRDIHPEFVFTYKAGSKFGPVTAMNNSAWQSARKKVGLEQVRVHDLKHTFGRRLRSAGVSFEDRQDLLGHRSGRITTHYSAAEIKNLIDAANKACCHNKHELTLTVLRSTREARSRKSPAKDKNTKPMVARVTQ